MTALAKRKKITKPEIAVVMDRLGLGYHYSDGKPFLKAEMQAAVITFGHCECGCGRSFNGARLEWEHTIPVAMQYEGDEVKWAAWRSDCHAVKTKVDKGDIARAKRRSGETGQYARRQRRDKPLIQGRTEIQSRGFQDRPDGHSAWPKRKMGGGYKSNVRLDD